MPAPIIPWQPSNIPTELQQELDRRKVNRSFKYIGNNQATWGENGDWNSYRGPMVSWVRFCSNSAGHPKTNPPKPRMVLNSGKGFYQSYGFQPPAGGGANQQVIGYTPSGQVHFIENSLVKPGDEPTNFPINVPPPEISRLEVTVQKELYRRAHVEWVCFSWKQLVYLTPYFLVPGITCMLEWGWNHFNVSSLVPLDDIGKMQQYWDNAYPLYFNNILLSKGNYDVIYGMVTNFNWSIEGNKIICMTEITSKDRLYAGIAKDYGMSVAQTAQEKKDLKPLGMFQSIKDFLGKDDTAKSLRTLVTKPNPLGELVVTAKATPQDLKWKEILNPLLLSGNADQQIMRRAFVFGMFAGRPTDSYETSESFGRPAANDFDLSTQDNDPNKIWINMGMVCEILNHFSAAPGGTKTDKNMFSVDIQNTVISGHPNLISCDPNVLIPNYIAPKYLYGYWGKTDAGFADPNSPYNQQWLTPHPIVAGSVREKADRQVSQVFYQSMTTGQQVAFRDNLDVVINYNRKRFVNLKAGGVQSFNNSWSFPSAFTALTPTSISGLAANEVEKDYSGLLSNIYISYAAFKDAVDNANNLNYTDIYASIFDTLKRSVDGFWDLALVDVDGTITVADRNYVGKYAFQDQPVYSFDYYDADSLIKSMKFRPQLSDAQATRVIYGAVNNKDSKFKYLDKNDVLDYIFRDAVIGPIDDKQQGGGGDLLKRANQAQAEMHDLVRSVQRINAKKDDGSLQMTIYPFRQKAGQEAPAPTIIKLCLNGASGLQLLRLLINDEDDVSNARYCAVQPNIVLELTILGIGGLRTFQYFLIRNLPEPYSDRNIIFRITDVIQTLESGNWETTIRAQPLPLRAYIRKRVRGPLTTSPNDGNGWPIYTTPTYPK